MKNSNTLLKTPNLGVFRKNGYKNQSMNATPLMMSLNHCKPLVILSER